MRATREMILFLVVLVVAGLWGYAALSGGPDATLLRPPTPPALQAKVGTWVPGPIAEGVPPLSPIAEPDRIFILEPREVVPLPPLDLPLPRLIDLPVTMPPPAPRPGWGSLASLRRTLVTVAPAAPADDTAGGGPAPGEEEPADEGSLDDLVNPAARRKEIAESDYPYLYDRVTFTTSDQQWGEVQDRQPPGHPPVVRRWGIYDIEAGTDQETFLFIWKDPKTGRVLGSSYPKRDGIASIVLADTVENAYGRGLRKIPDKEPGRFDGFRKLGLELMARPGRSEDEVQEALGYAEKCFRSALDVIPDDVRTVLSLSECMRRRGEWDEDLALLEDVSSRVHDPDLAIELGSVYEAFELPDLAEATYRDGLEAHPTSSALRRRLADVQLRRGQLAEALANYQNLVQFAAAEEDRAAAQVGLGLLALRDGKLEDALKAAESADRASGHPTAPSLTLRASALYMQRNWSQAADAARAAIDLEPGNVAAHRTLGLALALDGKLDEAKASFQAALDADPDLYADAQLGLGLVAQLSGDSGESVERYEIARAAAPRDPYMQYLLGVTYRREGPVDEALARLETALRLAPSFRDVLRQLGLVQQARGDWAASVKFLERAVELEPGDPDLRYVLVCSLLRDESQPRKVRLSAARAHLEKMLELRPDDPLALNGLGYVIYMLDPEQSKEARAKFDRVDQLLGERGADDPDLAYGRQTSADIKDHESKVIWFDRFDGGELNAERWWFYPPAAITGRVVDGRCLLEVRNSPQEEVYFAQFLDQGLRGRGELVEVGATLRTAPREDVTIGLIVYKQTGSGGSARVIGEIGLGRSFKNEVVYRQLDSRNKEQAWKPVLTDPEDPTSARKWPTDTGEPVRIVLRRTGDRVRGFWSLYLNDDLVLENVPVSTLNNRTDTITVGFVARGTFREAWKAEIDDFYMILRTRG